MLVICLCPCALAAVQILTKRGCDPTTRPLPLVFNGFKHSYPSRAYHTPFYKLCGSVQHSKNNRASACVSTWVLASVATVALAPHGQVSLSSSILAESNHVAVALAQIRFQKIRFEIDTQCGAELAARAPAATRVSIQQPLPRLYLSEKKR